MATAFQSNAFQTNAFQIEAGIADIVASASLTVGDLNLIARGKRGKNWPRLGPTPNHDTEYERWRVTNPQRET